MPPDGVRRAQGIRVIVRKANPKTPSKDQDGADFQESKNDTVHGDDDIEGEARHHGPDLHPQQTAEKEKNKWTLGFCLRVDLFDPGGGRGDRWTGWPPDRTG